MGNQQLQLHLQSDKVRKTETKAKSAFRSTVSAIYIPIYSLQLVDNMGKVLITFIAMMGLLMLDGGETVQALALPDVNSGAEQFISRMKRQARVVVADECKVAFADTKTKKKHRYVIFFIKDDTSINVEQLGDREASYDDFLHDLQKADRECRYGLYDYEYERQCQTETDKLCHWKEYKSEYGVYYHNTDTKESVWDKPECLKTRAEKMCQWKEYKSDNGVYYHNTETKESVWDKPECLKGTSIKKKLVMMLWCPDNAKMKFKMAYGSSFEDFKKYFYVAKYIKATDSTESAA